MDYRSVATGISSRLATIRHQRYGPRGKSRFARDLGIGPSTYDRYERDRLPPADLLVRAAHLTGTSLEWLLTGSGSVAVPPDPAGATEALLRRIGDLAEHDPEIIESIEQYLDLLASATERPHSVRAEGQPLPFEGMVPVVGSTAAGMARFWEELDSASVGEQADSRLEQVIQDYEQQSAAPVGSLRVSGVTDTQQVSLMQLSRPGAGGFLEFLCGTPVREKYPEAVAWRIDGDSMSPRYEDSDFVITAASEPAISGHPCVARQRGQIGVNCKLFQQQDDEIVLIPVNERYPAQRFPAQQLQWARRVLYSVRLH